MLYSILDSSPKIQLIFYFFLLLFWTYVKHIESLDICIFWLFGLFSYLRGSHGLSAWAWRTESRGPKGLQLEVGSWRTPRLGHIFLNTFPICSKIYFWGQLWNQFKLARAIIKLFSFLKWRWRAPSSWKSWSPAASRWKLWRLEIGKLS